MKNQINRRSRFLIWIIMVSLALIFVPNASAQFKTTVEDRVEALENYVDSFEPTLHEFSLEFESSIRDYTQQLQSSIQNYTKSFEQMMETRMKAVSNNKAFLDPSSNAYQQVKTKSGNFMVAVKQVMEIRNGGVRVFLEIGNPNYADYKNFTIKLVWGDKPPADSSEEYLRWRQTLLGTEFNFHGTLERGMWNEVQIDLYPAKRTEFGYLEVEMDVESIELKSKQYN